MIHYEEMHSTKKEHPREGNDWYVAADVVGLKHYPQVLKDSGKRPDVVVTSTKSDAMILA